jgi:capsular polysaccharide biosynthesis protein
VKSLSVPRSSPPRLPSARSVLRYWWVIFFALVSGIGATAFFAERQAPTYRASATLVVAPNDRLTDPYEIAQSLETLDRRTVIATFAMLPSSRQVQERARNHLSPGTSEFARYDVTTAVVPDTNIIRLSVQGPDRWFAAAFANALAAETIASAREYYSIYGIRVLDGASEQAEPVGPSLLRKVLAGALFGFLIGLVAAILLAYRATPRVLDHRDEVADRNRKKRVERFRHPDADAMQTAPDGV